MTLTNLANQEDRGKVTLEITDAETNGVVFRQEQTFRIDGNASEKKVFTFEPKQDNRKLLCRVLAEGQCHADGEQRELRVLPATVSLTYAHPFVLNKPGQYQLPFAAPSAYAENGTDGARSLSLGVSQQSALCRPAGVAGVAKFLGTKCRGSGGSILCYGCFG